MNKTAVYGWLSLLVALSLCSRAALGQSFNYNIGRSTNFTDPDTNIVWLPEPTGVTSSATPGTTGSCDDGSFPGNQGPLKCTFRRVPDLAVWEFPVGAAGLYEAEMYFTEPDLFVANERLFSVELEGVQVAAALDIIANVGFNRGTAILRTTVSITDGSASLVLRGIPIFSPSPSVAPPSPAPSVSVQPSSSPTKSQMPSVSPRPSRGTEEQNALVTCVMVIDENDADPFVDSAWQNFRNRFPSRPFCLLQPGEFSGPLSIPADFSQTDSTYSRVTRDANDRTNPSDWYSICGLESQKQNGITNVVLFVDNSGSMTTATVQTAFDLFLDQTARNNFRIVSEVTNAREDYIDPCFQTDLTTLTPAPSVQPSTTPSFAPSLEPSGLPSALPSSQPDSTGSSFPSSQPSTKPSAFPTSKPSSQPSALPSSQPSLALPPSPEYPVCFICGEGRVVTKPEGILNIPPNLIPNGTIPAGFENEPFSCSNAVRFGEAGFIAPEFCDLVDTFIAAIDPVCGCDPPRTPPPTPAPVVPPTPAPVFPPTPAPVVPPTPAPNQVRYLQTGSIPTDGVVVMAAIMLRRVPPPTPTPTRPPTPLPSPPPPTPPVPTPTESPSRSPSTLPSSSPSQSPSSSPTESPSQSPSNEPTMVSDSPSDSPSSAPSPSPSGLPSFAPVPGPTPIPTAEPTPSPTAEPTPSPTPVPISPPPTDQPVPPPTDQPVPPPTDQPVPPPTDQPVPPPTDQPVPPPTDQPVPPPTDQPIAPLTDIPVASPAPVDPPTPAPVVSTNAPVAVPTDIPQEILTDAPTSTPLEPGEPTAVPMEVTPVPMAPGTEQPVATTTVPVPLGEVSIDLVVSLTGGLSSEDLPIPVFQDVCTGFLQELLQDVTNVQCAVTGTNSLPARRQRELQAESLNVFVTVSGEATDSDSLSTADDLINENSSAFLSQLQAQDDAFSAVTGIGAETAPSDPSPTSSPVAPPPPVSAAVVSVAATFQGLSLLNSSEVIEFETGINEFVENFFNNDPAAEIKNVEADTMVTNQNLDEAGNTISYDQTISYDTTPNTTGTPETYAAEPFEDEADTDELVEDLAENITAFQNVSGTVEVIVLSRPESSSDSDTPVGAIVGGVGGASLLFVIVAVLVVRQRGDNEYSDDSESDRDAGGFVSPPVPNLSQPVYMAVAEPDLVNPYGEYEF